MKKVVKFIGRWLVFFIGLTVTLTKRAIQSVKDDDKKRQQEETEQSALSFYSQAIIAFFLH